MSQIKPGRRVRSFRRAMFILIILTLAVLGYLYWQSQQEQLPVVRVGTVATKDISSYLNVTATIKPGQVSQPVVSGQKVESVLVKAGDQVRAGDVLMTFDLAELEDQYKQAKELRTTAESAVSQAQNLVKKQASNAASQSAKLQKDIASLGTSINKITSSASTLLSTLPVSMEITPDVEAELKALIEAYDPNAPDAQQQMAAILDKIRTGVKVSDNPDYLAAKTALESSTANIGNLFSSITGGLVNVAGSALGSSATSQASGLITQGQSAVATATQAETLAKKALEQAKPDLRAEFDGLVVSVSAKPGDTLGGSVSSSLGSSLGGALGSSLGGSIGGSSALAGSLSSSSPVLVLYDNVNPKAIFRANRLDSSRLETGMDVTYEQDGKSYFGKITYKAKVATSGSLSSSGSSGSSSLLGSGTDLSSIGEPMLDIEMSIKGQDVADLIIGFTIDAQIRTDRATQVPCVPAEALKRELGQYFVFVLKSDNTLEKRFIKPGIQSDVDAQVLEGLADGERVVLNPSNSLAAGTLVTVRTGDDT